MTLLKETEWDSVLHPFKQRLLDHDYQVDSRNNLLHIASVISAACEAIGCPAPILVGGLAVEMYTKGDYATKDIDFITEFGPIVRKVMEKLGFTYSPKHGFFTYPKLNEIVEFPDDTLDGDTNRIVKFNLDNGLFICVMSVEDAIILRIEEFVHWWKSKLTSPAAVQLMSLIRYNRDELDMAYLQHQAERRGLVSALQTFIDMKETSI